jgi:hypothetical protein
MVPPPQGNGSLEGQGRRGLAATETNAAPEFRRVPVASVLAKECNPFLRTFNRFHTETIDMPHARRVLVTGGGGLIGRVLVPYLARSTEVVSLDLIPVPAASQSIVGSVTDPPKVLAAVDGVDAVLHMAYAHVRFDDLAYQIDVNIRGMVNVLEACVAKRVPRIAFASTVMTVWGLPGTVPRPAYHHFEPVNFYSYTKCCQELLAEMYTRQHPISAVGLRFGQPVLETGNPTRVAPKFGLPRDTEVLVPFEDLCEVTRLALLEAADVTYATLFVVGDYGGNHYDIERLKKTLRFQPRWRVRPDPEVPGGYLFERTGEPEQSGSTPGTASPPA